MSEEEAKSWLEQEFRRCWQWLDDALGALPYRTHRMEDIWDGLERGVLQLWPGPHSACLTQVDIYPTGVKVLTGLLAGGDLSEIKVTIAALEKYAKEAGCHYATMQGRAAWERAIPGYKPFSRTCYREL